MSAKQRHRRASARVREDKKKNTWTKRNRRSDTQAQQTEKNTDQADNTHKRAPHTRNEGPGSDTTKDHQPKAGTWSPTVHRPKGTSQDCTRVFLVEGATDALCHPEAGVSGQVSGQTAGGARLGGNPIHDLSQRAWDHPPLPASKTSEQKVAPRSATSEAVSWKARLRASTSWNTSTTEGVARRGGRRGAVMRPRNPKLQQIQRRPGEPGCQQDGDQQQPGEEARKRGHGRGRCPPGSGGLGRRRRPSFSNSGETEVNSATAEQTTSRTALWRRRSSKRGA